jgi:hypothetical protein
MDEEGSVRMMRDILSPLVGRRNIDRYRPMISRENLSTSAKSFALLENYAILEGHSPKAGRDQLHKAHLEIHMQIVTPIVQAAQQNQLQDFAKAAQSLQLALVHSAEHIQLYGSDPAFEEEAQAMMKQLKPAMEMLQKIMKVAEQQARMQADSQQAKAQAGQQAAAAAAQAGALNGQPLPLELQLKKYEIDKKDVVSRMEQESLNRMRDDKTAVQNQIRLREAQNNMAIARMTAQAKAQTGATPAVPQETGPNDIV